MANRPFRSAALVAGLALAIACGPAAAQPRTAPADLVVFAPHPDDEVIGTGGVIQRAVASGQRVLVVFVTNGDGYADAASALTGRPTATLQAADYVTLAAARQREAVAADAILGLGAANLVFLGYPDGALAGLYADAGVEPVRSPTTGRTATYGAVETDFHTLMHGQPAAYTRDAALADVREILVGAKPAQVFVTGPADQHPDHRATYELVREAMASIDFKGALLTFVVHSGAGWPSPVGPTPGSPFASRTIGGTTYPVGVPWPPPIRIPLTVRESTLKLQAIDANHSELAPPTGRLFLESFVKSDEVFWTAGSG